MSEKTFQRSVENGDDRRAALARDIAAANGGPAVHLREVLRQAPAMSAIIGILSGILLAMLVRRHR